VQRNKPNFCDFLPQFFAEIFDLYQYINFKFRL
jgi:hypothetical protein